MTRSRSAAMRNRIYSFVSAAIIALNSIPFVNFTAANAAKSASNSDSVFFPAVADGSNESAKLYHDDSLVDNGDGTFTFTSKITSAFSYSDYSESRLKSKDGEYKLDKEGKYLIEVWGGDGGDGSRSLLTGRNGVGGKGGFVYGILDVSEENELLGKKLVYEIGSKGESSTFQLDGGGTGGVGGGAGTITFISIGAGGGYSAVYLIDSDPDPEKDEKLDPADLKPNLRDDPEKVLMIAGGGGGGAAGGNGIHFYELFLKAKGDGGDGGSNKSAIQATPAIGVFNTGKYYSGADGTSAGGNTRYVGHGGTDKPGEATRDAFNIIKGDNPNDWQRLYIEDGDRGAGSAGNLRGAGGGAGFAGGSGGLQNAMIDANNVGGGGGGSSYVASTDTITNFYPFNTKYENDGIDNNDIEDNDYFVQQEDNIYADVGGAVVIRYLPDDADYGYLNDVKISGTVSNHFDIVSASCSQNGGAPTDITPDTGLDIEFTGSIAPVSSGIAKGQADDSMTLKLVLRPITGFMGGNKVPIFADDGEFTCKTIVARFYENNDINSTTDKQRSFAYAENVRFVNIPFKYKAGAVSKTISIDTQYDESDIIDSTVTNTLDANFANSVSPQYLDADGTTWVNTGHTYTTDADGKVTIDGLPYGTYYLVETAAPAGYMIDKTPIEFTIDGTSGNNQVTVENEKILGVDKEIAYDAAGNTYNWVIKGDIPDDPSKLSAYAITDAYSASALENVAVSSVKVGTTDLALTTDYTVTTGDGTLTITFTPAGLLKLDKNGTVTTVDVTVSSTIVSAYSSASVSNSASIAYIYGATSTGPVISPTPDPVNYPTTPVDPATPTEDTKEVTLATLIISNTGSGELAGATYKLEKADGTAISDAFNTLTDDSTLADPNTDKVVVANLAPGAYKITQTGIGSAASDHLLNDTPRLIYVGDDGNIYESDKTTPIADGGVQNQVQFVNTAKGTFNLPFTGTTATIIFTITGILLMAGTGFLIFMILKKRDDDEEDEEQVNN